LKELESLYDNFFKIQPSAENVKDKQNLQIILGDLMHYLEDIEESSKAAKAS
jgi:hypothetical protein